jgi:hypothetical protein
MITRKSHKREISDLQRLLLSLGLMSFTDTTKSGQWGDETQAGVVRLYDHLGWAHPAKGRWVTAPALAAIASALHTHESGVGGTGSHAGGTGSHAGGTGSHAGGTGSHAGGGSSPE